MAELPPAEEIDVQEILNKYLDGEIDLICVLGPTASGKTRYAVRLARQINALLEKLHNDEALPGADSLEDRATRGTKAGVASDMQIAQRAFAASSAKRSGGVSAANVRAPLP